MPYESSNDNDTIWVILGLTLSFQAPPADQSICRKIASSFKKILR